MDGKLPIENSSGPGYIKNDVEGETTEKQDDMPIWVYLPFASVETRKGACVLVWCNVLCSLYCIPWSQYFREVDWVAKIFLIDNWYWFVLMLALTVWYGVGFLWLDRRKAWSMTDAP